MMLTFLSCSVIKFTNDDDFKAVSIGNCVEDFNYWELSPATVLAVFQVCLMPSL